ncbi:MAG: DUF3267 domain-containing protein [Armatimonadetes bacterium]|nr:DUF3267 domain-containing protein [Armatimonadota bacterium]
MIIPGFLISWLTFPGVIVHELAHAIFCRLYGVAIYEVKFFRFAVGLRQPVGYVIHEGAKKASQNLMISIGPFFVNTIIGGIIGAPAAIPVFKLGSFDPLDLLLIWLGVSIAMHAFPSTGDAASIRRALKHPDTPTATKIWATPIMGLIYLGALGSMFWLDALYGVAVVGLIPLGIVYLFSH